MPFAIKDVLQHKRNERQIREIHEREYSKYISDLRRQSFHSNLSHLSSEYLREIERSKKRNILNKKIQYERIQRDNDLLAKRLFQTNRQSIVDDRNDKYEENLNIFNSKRSQQRSNEYKRIHHENQVLDKRFQDARGRLSNKNQCDQDWQGHIRFMKKTCDYPENIDAFVSNGNQQRKSCKWEQQYNTMQRVSRITEYPLIVLLGLSE